MRKVMLNAVLVIASSAFVTGGGSVLMDSPAAFAQAGDAQVDSTIQAAMVKSLKNKQFNGVQVTVQGGVIDLNGSVANFAVKEEADQRAHRVKGVSGVRNNIRVTASASMSDQQLQQKILKQIQYDRVGFGQAFSAISVSVQNGVVTLGGHALGPVAASDAVNLASRTAGVQDVINNIQVDPLSPMDDQTRMQVYRAVYGYPTLSGYSMDPAQPIRITVVNGNVLLSGVVNSQMDKNVAGIQANGVPGVFKVTNNLQVAGSSSEKK